MSTKTPLRYSLLSSPVLCKLWPCDKVGASVGSIGLSVRVVKQQSIGILPQSDRVEVYNFDPSPFLGQIIESAATLPLVLPSCTGISQY